MTQPENAKVSLELPARSDFLPLIQDCVEKGAALFGLKDARLMGLNLAVEEIFLHLCRVSSGDYKETDCLYFQRVCPAPLPLMF